MRNPIRLRLHDEPGPGGLTPDLVARLRAEVEGAGEGCLVTLEGGAEAFCLGWSMESLVGGADGAGAALEDFARLLRALLAAPGPVVALVDGPAMGGGLGLAAAADLVLASPRARFGLPEALMGLVPAVVFPVVARRLGPARARWLALGAATLSADEARAVGLVDEVADDLEGALARYQRRFRRMDPQAMAAVKALAAAHERDPAAYAALAAERFLDLLGSDGTRARIDRFMAGGAPWDGDEE